VSKEPGSILKIKLSNGKEEIHHKNIADQLYESFMNGLDEYYFSFHDENLSIHYQRGYVSKIIYLRER